MDKLLSQWFIAFTAFGGSLWLRLWLFPGWVWDDWHSGCLCNSSIVLSWVIFAPQGKQYIYMDVADQRGNEVGLSVLCLTHLYSESQLLQPGPGDLKPSVSTPLSTVTWNADEEFPSH